MSLAWTEIAVLSQLLSCSNNDLPKTPIRVLCFPGNVKKKTYVVDFNNFKMIICQFNVSKVEL